MTAKYNLLKVFSVIAILAMTFSSVQPGHVQAQSGDGLKRQVNAESGRVSFITPADGQPLSAVRALGQSIRPQDPAMALAAKYAPEFGLQNAERSLTAMDSNRTKDGRLTVRFQQNFENVPVMGGELIVNTNDNGDLYSISGEVSPGLSLSTQPAIDANSAQDTALHAMAKWYGMTSEDFTSTEPELWVYDESLLQPSTRPAELTWRMEITPKDAGMPVRELVLVNAQRGSISQHFNQIDTIWSASEAANNTSLDATATATPEPTEILVDAPVTPESSPLTTEGQAIQESVGTATLLYVATTGNDANSCELPASPCATLFAAIEKAASGATIEITDGTYSSHNPAGEDGFKIQIPLNIRGGWNASFTTQTGMTTLDGQGTTSAVIFTSQDTLLERLRLQNSGYTGLTMGGGLAKNVLLKQSVVNGNSWSGIEIYESNLVVENSTISGNAKEGLRVSSGTAKVTNSTITGNAARGINSYAAQNAVSIQNTILSGNTENESPLDCYGITSLGNNIIGTTNNCFMTTQGSDLVGVDPEMSTFIDTGYYALSAGSPAIGAANVSACPATDQRGLARLGNGTCDIGAYEYTIPGPAASLAVYSGDNQSAAPNLPFFKPFKILVLDAQGNLVPNLNITFTAPASGASGIFAASGTRTTSVLTDPYGIATASTFTSNSQYGAYTVTASAAGLTSVNFSLANRSLYVSPAGNDSNNCTAVVTPCATINGAITKAADGDTIEVAEGIYTGSGTEVALIDKSVRLIGGWNLTFTSQTGYSTIDGQGARRGAQISAADVELSRFKVQNCGNSGIYIASLSAGAVINNSMIFNNNSGAGGGIYNIGSLVLNNSSVFSNHALNNGDGGGIYNQGKATINNSTISKNTSYTGGGIYNSRTVTLNNVTISDNEGSAFGGGIYQVGGTFTLKNSIAARNTSYWSSKDCQVSAGSIISYDYNLIGNTTACTIDVTHAGHDLLNVDPKLGAANPSLGFVPLLATSPAIDAGNPANPGSGANACLGTDQRGATRPLDGPDQDTVAICDMGAVEYAPVGEAAKIYYSMGSPQTVAPNTKLSVHPQVVVTDNFGSPKPGVAVTFTAPASGPSGSFVTTGSNASVVTTDASGTATAPDFVANGETGSYQIVASVATVTETVAFAITNASWYVSVNGDNANDCASAATPCATVQGVLAKPELSAGNTILVAQGLYNTPDSISLTKDIILRAGWNASFTSQTGTSVFEDTVGVYPEWVNVTIENITVRNIINSSGLGNSGNLVLKNSSIINNNQGIYNRGNLTIINSTISGNGKIGIMPGNGAAIQNDAQSARILLLNSTVTDNAAYNTGGISNSSTAAGIVTLQNSIVAGNTGRDCEGGDYSGTLNMRGLFMSLGNNIIGDIGTYNGAEYPCRAVWQSTDFVGDHARPVKANLEALVNAGNDLWVHRLKFGSPAIDLVQNHSCPETDQLGLTRPQGASCDSGAVEFVFDRNAGSLLVSTYNENHSTTLPGTFVCNQTNPTCSNGDAHAKAAHQYAIGTYNLYKSKHGRSSIDNNGFEINSTVHFGSGYANAFWNGYMMVYGDKYGFPLADDVVAHELTHGVTQFESNLFYYYQSGAINESFSDLWGEYYDQTNAKGNDTAAAKWLLGEDVSGQGAMRNMSNPPALGDPDKMSSTYYYEGGNDNGGVHTNSGVNNKAVYLMVQGGTFNGRTVTALGWDKVAAIYYEANTNLLTSSADYSDLYHALQTACAGLLGQKGLVASNCTEVKDALDAVEMNAQPATNFNTEASLCPTYGTYPEMVFSDDLENGTGNWVFVNGTYPRWQYDSPYGLYAQSGQHSLYADDYPQYDNKPTDARATLASFTVPANGYLWFAQAYDFEYDSAGYYDGGVLEYSKDNGVTWIDAAPLIQVNGYKAKVYSGYGNPLSGRSAFVGASHGYTSTRLNLASLAGQTVSFRWRMGLDGGYASWGWWVDNVQVYTCQATTFADVPFSHPFYNDIEILYANGLTGGCSTSPLKFCPDQIMNRGQAAAFILRGNFGSSYVPPVPTHVFLDDWSKGTWAEGWAEGMRNEGLSAGCSSNPLKYCPWEEIPREQAVIFAVRMKYGKDYTPPPATGTVFADMTNPAYYATSWAEQAYTDGIIKDCGIDSASGKPMFCPKVLVSRGLAAYMIVRAKNLTMP